MIESKGQVIEMTRVDESVAVWVSDQGIPLRIVWRARRYRVSDTPTRLGWPTEPALSPAITHPPSWPEAWRFQGTADGGDTLVFDVSRDPWGERWRLIRTYE